MARAAVADFSGFEIVYDHPNYHSDHRSGHIHGWNEGGWYLGNFTSHKRAREAGARFCNIGNIWFDWNVYKLGASNPCGVLVKEAQ